MLLRTAVRRARPPFGPASEAADDLATSQTYATQVKDTLGAGTDGSGAEPEQRRRSSGPDSWIYGMHFASLPKDLARLNEACALTNQ